MTTMSVEVIGLLSHWFGPLRKLLNQSRGFAIQNTEDIGRCSFSEDNQIIIRTGRNQRLPQTVIEHQNSGKNKHNK